MLKNVDIILALAPYLSSFGLEDTGNIYPSAAAVGGLETPLVEDQHQRGRGGWVKKTTVKGMGSG